MTNPFPGINPYVGGYTPPAYVPGGANAEVRGQTRTPRQRPAQNTMEVFRTGDPMVLRVELTFNDFSEGLDLMQTHINPGNVPNQLASSTLDHRWRGTLCLLPLVTRVTLA